MKTYNLYCKDENSFEYVFTVREEVDPTEKTHYQLTRSDADHWTHPEELLFSAIDNGNEFLLEEKIGKTLDYSKFGELNLFLNLIKNNDKGIMGKFLVIDTSTINEI